MDRQKDPPRPVGRSGRGSAPSAETSPLTEREIEVMDCLVRGLSYAEAAARLGISQSTARTHVRNCYIVFGISGKRGGGNRSALMRAHMRSKIPWAAAALHEQHNTLSEERWVDVCGKVLDALEAA